MTEEYKEPIEAEMMDEDFENELYERESEDVRLPVLDLHCDLLAYIAGIDGADPMSDDIGCSLPALEAGNVKLQTLAIFTVTGAGSVESGTAQAEAFDELLGDYSERVQPLDAVDSFDELLASDRVSVIGAIENASGFCGEDDDLDEAFERLEFILDHAAPVLYLSMTHNKENRFGGGNDTTDDGGGGVGLKDDGRVLLEYLSGRRIAIDLAHTSDALARDIVEYTYSKSLDIPIMASHSNFRGVHQHVRNLPDDVAREIIARGGLIGMNFCHDFIHPDDSDVLIEHIAYGFDELGGLDAIAFGSDFFYTPDDSEFYYDHRNSAQFPAIIRQAAAVLNDEQLHGLAYGNVLAFMRRVWG